MAAVVDEQPKSKLTASLSGKSEPAQNGSAGNGESKEGASSSAVVAATKEQGPEEVIAIKHPLQNSWTLWYDNPGKKANQGTWSQNLKKVLTFSTVEDFWGLYNNIVPASKLVQGSNYHLFKEGVEPAWEDKANLKGGKWVANVSPKQRASDLDKRWLWMMLACVGDSFPDADQICGVVVSLRKTQDRLAVWTSDSTNREAAIAIGQHFKTNVIELPLSTKLTFQSHEDAMKRDSSFNNPYRYEV